MHSYYAAMTKITVKDILGRKVTIRVGGTYSHDHYGRVTVLSFDEKHGKPVAILSNGNWGYATDLA